MFYMDTTKAPFNDPRVTLGDEADRRPPGAGGERDQRLRHGRQRHRRQGPAVLRQVAAAARAGHRQGQVAAQGRRPVRPHGRSSDLARSSPASSSRRRCSRSRRRRPASRSTSSRSPPSSYYNPSLLYLKMPFAETQWPISSLKFFYLQALASNAPYNETHWKSASWNDAAGQGDRRAQQDQGAVALEPGAADPVRPGRLPQLDERRLGRRRSRRRCRASSRAPPARSATTASSTPGSPERAP